MSYSDRAMALTALFAAIVSCHGQNVTPQELTAGDFEKLHRQLQPRDEAWRAVPWKLTLMEALEQAVREIGQEDERARKRQEDEIEPSAVDPDAFARPDDPPTRDRHREPPRLPARILARTGGRGRFFRRPLK